MVNGEVAKVVSLPDCDFKSGHGPCSSPKAEYDFVTRMGPWANGCHAHYETYRRYENLGVGRAQKLEEMEPSR